MLLYALRRLGAGIVLFLLTSFTTLYLIHFSFAGIVATRLGTGATPETIAQMMHDHGLDRPVLVQYVDWFGSLLQGDLGRSFFTQEVVTAAIGPRIIVTLSIVLPALIGAAIFATLLGVLAAYKGGWVDKVAQGAMLFGHLVPGLLVAIFLVMLFAVNLGWFPATGFVRFGDDPVGWLRSITIPVIALFVGGSANMANQVRGTMIDELRKDYVRTLRTAGVSPKAILLRHALRNAIGPGITVFGMQFITMFGGALIIESVFALPGFGTFAFNSAMRGDFPVIMGLTAVGVGLTVGVNLIVDLANGWLNPKARAY
ncbi:MAG: ABC transporter permease [Promicromonosporaceae bacterium]|nr:ABC transporter permease [Promicromonosporaceae bacterium]